jgi:hypothetical protein
MTKPEDLAPRWLIRRLAEHERKPGEPVWPDFMCDVCGADAKYGDYRLPTVKYYCPDHLPPKTGKQQP